MDLFITLYQSICVSIYRIPKVKRAAYVLMDRGDLPYLNLIEKFNCLYCSYGNGVAAYTREVAAPTADLHIAAAYDDREALSRMAKSGAAITTEFEGVPAETLAYLAAFVPVQPSTEALAI